MQLFVHSERGVSHGDIFRINRLYCEHVFYKIHHFPCGACKTLETLMLKTGKKYEILQTLWICNEDCS